MTFILALFNCCDYEPILKYTMLDDSYQWENIVKGRIGVGAVLFSGQPLADQESTEYSALLQKSFQAKKKYHRIKIVPTPVIIQKLGWKNYQRLLKDYKKNETISKAWLTMLKKKVTGVRYLFFALIYLETVGKEKEKNTEQPINHATARPSNNLSITGSYFHICDLKKAIIAAKLMGWPLDYNKAAEDQRPEIKQALYQLFGIFVDTAISRLKPN